MLVSKLLMVITYTNKRNAILNCFFIKRSLHALNCITVGLFIKYFNNDGGIKYFKLLLLNFNVSIFEMLTRGRKKITVKKGE